MPTTTLLATKYAMPQPMPGLVARAHLTQALDATRGVVLVSAPPGYGKTTLVAGWLEQAGLPTAWVTLDETDNDPAVFAAYLAAAVRQAVPTIPEAVERAVIGEVSTAALAPLINALAAIGEPVAIVLDDCHTVTSDRGHALLANLVRHLPGNVRLVIVTRQDPPIALARLRVRGLLTEVRAADLRFSSEDAARFLGNTLGLALSPETVGRLADRTEGWVAGLQLAGVSLRSRPDADSFVEAVGSTDRYIFDFLTDEALAHQPPAIRSFLEATCILGRLSAPLCDAVTGNADGAAMLAAIGDANLFLTPMDDRRAWFRYHRLFADLISSGLTAGRRTDLHRRAGAWFAANGLRVEAIRHSLAAGDAEDAAGLMEAAADRTLARGETRTVVAWSRALPPGVLAAHPALGVMQAWATFILGDIPAAETLLGGLDDTRLTDPAAGGRRDCLAAWFANRRDDPDAEDLARRAIDGIPETDPVFRSLAFTTLGEATVSRDVGVAVEAFTEAYRLARPTGRGVLYGGAVYSLANTGVIQGRRREAEALCRRTIEEATRDESAQPWLGMVYLPLGTSLFEANELDQAHQHITTGQELCDRAGLRITMLGASEWYEVLGLHVRGQADQAWRRVEAIAREARAAGIERVAKAMTLVGCELLLLEGDVAGARRRMDLLPTTDDHVLGTMRDRSRQTPARLLVVERREREAIAILESLAREQRARGRLGRLVLTLTTLAVAHERVRERGAALEALREAVALAAPEGYRRAFVDPVLPLGELLSLVRPESPTFIDAVSNREAPAPRSPSGVAEAAGTGGDVLLEPLSVRELEVLRLVAAGLSNEEIGRALFVSQGTAKWHVHNVIGKLGARNRVTLVARARRLQLV